MSSQQQRILGLETSGRLGSVALADETGVVASAGLFGEMKHVSELMPAIDGLLKDQDWPADSLTDVYVSIGPGSFTGLRIGVAIARTLGWSIGARIVAVPTMNCLACNALEARPAPAHLALVLDAKANLMYTAVFELRDGEYVKTVDACLAEPRAFLSRCPRPLAVLGEGVPRHRAAIEASGATILPAELWPGRAENVIRVGAVLAEQGQFTAPGDLVPLYIRRPEMEERWERRQVKNTQSNGKS